MQLPASFVDYARALLGEAEYNRFSAALLEDEQPVSIRLNPQKWDNSSFFILHSSFFIKRGPLGYRCLLPGPASDVYLRPPVPRRGLLRAGGVVHVCGAGGEAVSAGAGSGGA